MRCAAIIKTKKQCSRITIEDSLYCWQHKNIKSTNQNILSILNKDIFANIGEFLDYSDIANAKKSKFPANLITQKYCYTLNYRGLESLKNLYKNLPRLKSIILYVTSYMGQKEADALFTLLKKFKNLERLEINVSNTYDGKINFDINWFGFNLKALDTPFLINTEIPLFYEMPTLEFLKMYQNHPNIVNNDTAISLINPNLISLDLSEYVYTNIEFNNFKQLKELIISRTNADNTLLSSISELKTLEVLSIPNDDYLFLNSENLHLFPNWIRLLDLEFIGYEYSVFTQLQFPNLEYLSMRNLRSLQHILDVLETYPNLKHLSIHEIKFSLFDGIFFAKLRKLKQKKPDLTFDFEITKLDTINHKLLDIEREMEVAENQDELDDLYRQKNSILHIIPREEKAELKYWPILQKIFGLANIIDSPGHRKLQENQYTIKQWRKDNGYYIYPC